MMKVRFLNSTRLNGVISISYLGEDLLLATSQQEVFWLRIQGSRMEVDRSLSLEGSLGPLYPVPELNNAMLQVRQGFWDYSALLVDKKGFTSERIPIPFYGFDQVTSDPSGSLLAAFGTAMTPGRAGYIEPVESCLIDCNLGRVQRLPYSAVAIRGDTMYFLRDRTLYRAQSALCQQRTYYMDSALPDDSLAVVASDRVLSLSPGDEYTCLATECGVWTARSSGITIVHKWEHASRVVSTGDVFFATDVGPEVNAYDSRRNNAAIVTASGKKQVTGVDALCTVRSGKAAQGVLTIASENGVLDHFSWESR